MCNICIYSFKQSDLYHLPGCDHEYCKNCMAEHLAINIKEGKVLKIKCMDINCPLEFTEDDILNFGS